MTNHAKTSARGSGQSRERWDATRIPELQGLRALVTGANSGIGLETARVLTARGAHVILACRSAERGQAALESVRQGTPAGTAELRLLDLADLDSVAALADELGREDLPLDLLIANAGVMAPPERRSTAQGHELQFGTNHLGHFALVGGLLPLLQKRPGGRVVVVSSMAHRFGRLDLDDVNFERRAYKPWDAYGQSKLANLLFQTELQQRLAGLGIRVTAAHPGWTATNLQQDTPLVRLLNPLFGMKPAEGALPTLRAALDPDLPDGAYVGPRGPFELRGAPVEVKAAAKGRDREVAGRLWSLSEELTGVGYGV